MKTFSWDITSECNFKCFYCFFSEAGWENLKKLEGPVRPIEKVVDAWRYIFDIYGSCKIYITGGEPFCYPNFTDLIYEISKFHYVHITTNLSLDMEDFIKKIDNKKVEFNTTFHPMFMDLDNFIKKFLDLRKSNFKSEVCYLFHPIQISDILSYKKYFYKYDINLNFVMFNGRYREKKYPENFTKEEKEFFRYVSNWPKKNDDFFSREKNNFLILNKEENTNIKLCPSGINYASIRLDGMVRCCGQREDINLGNLYLKNIKLLKNKHFCDKYCKCKEYKI